MADGSDRICNHSKGDTLKSKGRGCHIHMPLKETDFKFKGTGKWKGKSWGMIDPANGNRKRAGVSRINSKQNELEDVSSQAWEDPNLGREKEDPWDCSKYTEILDSHSR